MSVVDADGSGAAPRPAVRRTRTAHKCPGLMARVARYEVDEVVRAAAATYPDAALRFLDAIHLATAHAAFSSWLVTFVAYDERLLAAAAAVGLPTAAPGRHQP